LACHYGYCIQGQRAEAPGPFVRGTRYTLVAAMSLKGYIATRVVEGSLDSEAFFDFITDQVVCIVHIFLLLQLISLFQVPKMNPFPDEHSVLVMDNCRIHHNDALLESLNSCGE
jgi:hypothetical protein